MIRFGNKCAGNKVPAMGNLYTGMDRFLYLIAIKNLQKQIILLPFILCAVFANTSFSSFYQRIESGLLGTALCPSDLAKETWHKLRSGQSRVRKKLCSCVIKGVK